MNALHRSKAKSSLSQGIKYSFLIVTILFSLGVLNPATAASTDYYVDNTNPSCSDSGSGTLALPFCTISQGASVAIAGDTVRVLAGSYAETVSVPKSGSAGLPITYSAAPGVTVTGNGSASSGGAFRITSKSYIVVDGFTITGTADRGIYVSASNNITLMNNHVSYSGQPVSGSTRAGIYLNSTSNSTIRGNTTDHNTLHGIHLINGSNNNLVSDNVSFGNAQQYQRDASGIRLDGTGTTNNSILHNLSYANEDSGITNYSGAGNNLFVGNLLYGNGDHGIDNYNAPGNTLIGNTAGSNHTAGFNFEGTAAPASSGATLRNNISVDNGLNPITGQKSNIRVDALSVSGTSLDYDLVYLSGAGTVEIQWNGTNYATLAAFKTAVPSQEVHGLQADPLFVAPVGYATRPPAVVVGDYHIKVGSPAIDSANADAPSEPLLDLDGNGRVDDPATINTGAGVRTYDDRGVYEFQPAGGAISTPTNTLVPTATPTAQLPTFTPTATATAQLTTFTPTVAGVPSSLTFIASADSYVNQANPTSNYGTNAQMWDDGDVGATYQSYLKFSVSGIIGTVQSAILRVYSTSGTVSGPAVYATASTWTETGITWNARPTLTSSVLDVKGAVATGVWVEYDVTAQVIGDDTYSFGLIPTSTDGVSFSSREGSQPPQLVVKYALQSGTATSAATSTSTLTAIYTSTPTATPTASDTSVPPTVTFTYTPTNTSSPTATFTLTPTATFTDTPADTLTPTDTLLPPTATFTFTPTNTPLPPTATFTYTASPTATFTSTATDTPVPPTETLLPSTATFTYTPTDTLVPPTATLTATPAFTAISTNTPMAPTATDTYTPTSTASPTATFTFTPTATLTFTPTDTFTPTSTPTNTLGPITNTGFHVPAANNSVTSSAGDNNGYETNPVNAYIADGLFAVDSNSGTNSSASCTNSGKDKHLFYNYTLNVPTNAAIQGIEVKLTGKVNNTSSAPVFCVQLSWDGGTTWTTAKSTTTLSTTNTAYTLGTSSDLWARTWSGLDLSDVNFRVQIIDVSGSTSRTFSLDAVAVQVTYR